MTGWAGCTPILFVSWRSFSRYNRHMNQHASASESKKSQLPPEYIPPISLDRFCEISGLSKTSAWRYEKRGWLRTHLIANRRYILAAEVAEFNRRLARNEFAGPVTLPINRSKRSANWDWRGSQENAPG
jgi:hypothetical protein